MRLAAIVDILSRRAFTVVHALAISVALFWWSVWAPMLMSYDSYYQYQQARLGEFTDAQPPLLSVSLHVLLRALGDPTGLHALGALQCVLGLLGVVQLAAAVQANADGLRAKRHWWAALAVAVVLLNPYSPLGVYLVTYWKDVWLLIGGTWLGAVALRLAEPSPDASSADLRAGHRLAHAAKLAGLTVLMGVVLLTRHNAILLAPVQGAVLVTLAVAAAGLRGRSAVLLGLGAVVAPVAAMRAVDVAMRSGVPIRHVPLESHPLALELIHVLAENPDAAGELPHTTGALAPDWRERVTLGWVDSCWPVCRAGFYEEPEPIWAEYLHTLCTRPMAVLRAKWTGFFFHLVPNRCEPFVTENVPMPINGRVEFASQPEWSARWRQKWSARLRRSFESRRGWVFCKHLPWMAVSAGLLLAAGYRAVRTQTAPATVAALLTGLPVGYYSAYLVASTAGDFRYMYPADVWTQVSALSLLASWFAATRRATASETGSPPAELREDG